MREIALTVVVFCGLVVVLRSPFTGVLMWQWFSLMNPHHLTWGFITQAPTAAIIAGTTLLALLVSREPKLPPIDASTLLIALLWVSMSVSTIFALAPQDAVLDKWEQTSKMLLFVLVTYALITTEHRFDLFIWVVAFSIAIFGIKGGIFSLLTGGKSRVYGPVGSMITDNNTLGLALLMVHPLLFALLANHKEWYLRLITAGAIILNTFGIFFTYSRGAFLGAAAMMLFLWLRSRRKVLVGAVIGCTFAGVLALAPVTWFERMSTIESYQEDNSAMSRIHFWKIAFTMAETRPLVGAGFRYMLYPQIVDPILVKNRVDPIAGPHTAHSIWFEMLGEHGVPGFLLFAALAFVAWRNCSWTTAATKARPELLWHNNFSRMIQVGLVGYFVSGSFLSMSTYDGYFDIVIMAAALRRLVAQRLAVPAVPQAALQPMPAPTRIGQQPAQRAPLPWQASP